MATVTQVMRSCDICGKEKDVQTWTFGLEGKTYEIDLCPKDGRDLGKVAAGYISNARRASARQGQRRGGRARRLSGHR
jgi:Lsr2